LTARRAKSRVFSSVARRTLPWALSGLTLVGGLNPAFAQGTAPAVPPPPAAPATPAVAAPASPAASAATAKTSLAAGDKAAKAKDWATALSQYQAAMNAVPGAQAQEGIANALYQQKSTGEAYDAYDLLLKSYNGGRNKGQATARLKELAPLTGYLSIRVNEAGAAVSIDGKAVGMSPVEALIRVSSGPHKVDVAKDGFTPVSKSPNVGGNGKEIVEIQLAREATTGHLSVKEHTGAPVRVLVDGTDVGAAPLDVEVSPGAHEVVLRSSTMASSAQTVQVARGETANVELTAVAASAHLEVTTSDRKGIIFLDGKPVAEGAFAGDIGVGPHTISVTEDGYERFDKKVVLVDKQTLAETVTLERPKATSAGPAQTERSFDGLYGGIGGFGFIGVGGEGNEVDTGCSALEATSCKTASPVGGGLMGWVGWAWHPVGVELFLAGMADETTPSATFVGPTSPLEAPTYGPARVEQFLIVRYGGMAAVRARVSGELGEKIRLSLAAGFGASWKNMLFERDTSSNQGAQNVFTDKSGHSYFSPALSIDGSASLRLTPSLAIALGVMTMIETAGQSVQTTANTSQYIGSQTVSPQPIQTPSYHLASGTQVFLGPYVGLQFGP
jgi:hypothetical protein